MKLCALSLAAFLASPYAPNMGVLNVELSTKDRAVYDVDTGYKGLPIQRVIPSDETEISYIWKRYRPCDVATKKVKELTGLSYLKRVLAKAQGKTFDVVDILEADPEVLTVKLADTRGRSLLKVLRDRRIPRGFRDELLLAYHERLTAAKEAILAEEPPDSVQVTEGKDHYIVQFKKAEDPLFHIILSPAQVVISFDPSNLMAFSMKIVDSY